MRPIDFRTSRVDSSAVSAGTQAIALQNDGLKSTEGYISRMNDNLMAWLRHSEDLKQRAIENILNRDKLNQAITQQEKDNEFRQAESDRKHAQWKADHNLRLKELGMRANEMRAHMDLSSGKNGGKITRDQYGNIIFKDNSIQASNYQSGNQQASSLLDGAIMPVEQSPISEVPVGASDSVNLVVSYPKNTSEQIINAHQQNSEQEIKQGVSAAAQKTYKDKLRELGVEQVYIDLGTN